MKAHNIFSLAIIALTLISSFAYGQDGMPPREKWSLVTMEGTVTDIVKETREITLIGPEGGLQTITAGEAVKRFDEIAVDDKIVFDYWTYMAAEFRDPTQEELAEPLVVMAEGGVAPEGMDPGVVVGAVVKGVVTIEALNRPFMLATVKGPQGNYLTIDVEDAALLEKLHIGQVFILYYAEAIAVSLEKAN